MVLTGTLCMIVEVGDERMLMADKDVVPTLSERGMAVPWHPERGYSPAKDL